MNSELELKIQAYLDGELPPRKRVQVEALIARDVEAQQIYRELESVRAQLRAHEPSIALPDSPDFYWSTIKRRLATASRDTEAAPVRGWAWKKWALPLAGAAALFLVLLVYRPAAQHPLDEMETMLADMGTFTFRDHSAGVTMVWLYDRSVSPFTEAGDVDTVPVQ
jgi:anti-sigma factor RsiW